MKFVTRDGVQFVAWHLENNRIIFGKAYSNTEIFGHGKIVRSDIFWQLVRREGWEVLSEA